MALLIFPHFVSRLLASCRAFAPVYQMSDAAAGTDSATPVKTNLARFRFAKHYIRKILQPRLYRAPWSASPLSPGNAQLVQSRMAYLRGHSDAAARILVRGPLETYMLRASRHPGGQGQQDELAQLCQGLRLACMRSQARVKSDCTAAQYVFQNLSIPSRLIAYYTALLLLIRRTAKKYI